MKRAVFMLLAGALGLCAVEWEIERIPDDNRFYRVNPRLALDEQDNPYLLFIEETDDAEQGSLKVTTKKADGWVEKEVSIVTYGFCEKEIEDTWSYCSFAVDEIGNSHVTFTDFVNLLSDTTNLFIASDSSGSFEVRQLTDDEKRQEWPVVVLDEGKPIIAFLEIDLEAEVITVHYGEVTEEGGFVPEMIDTTLFWGLDLVFSDLHSRPSAFYCSNSTYISRATLISQNWTREVISDTLGVLPSAYLGPSGRTHVAYRTGEDLTEIRYLAEDASNSWVDEYVAEGCKMEAGLFVPCVAVNPDGVPYVAWVTEQEGSLDIYLAWETDQGWMQEAVTSDPENHEWPGNGRFFIIDSQGYGHLTYCAWDDTADAAHLYYAKSKTPLGVSEDQPARRGNLLEVKDATVYFTVAQASSVTLGLYDALGRHVSRLASGNYPEGEHAVPINTADLSAGVYFVRAEIVGRSASAKFVLIR